MCVSKGADVHNKGGDRVADTPFLVSMRSDNAENPLRIAFFAAAEEGFEASSSKEGDIELVPGEIYEITVLHATTE